MLQGTIAERCSAIRLDKKALARLANLSEKLIGRTLLGQSNPRLNNWQALEQAVINEELRMRDYLLSLHPLDRSTDGGPPSG